MRTAVSWAWMAVAGSLVLAGCKPSTPAAPVRPAADPALLARGEALFKQHCAACHGERAQGALNWHKPGADNKYPPPPLDGSAHAWHHSHAWLQDTIRHGTVRRGGGMPGWSGALSGADIDAVIAYFQSLWPGEIFRAWQDIDRRAREAAR